MAKSPSPNATSKPAKTAAQPAALSAMASPPAKATKAASTTKAESPAKAPAASATADGGVRRFTCVEGNARKFWEVSLAGSDLTVRFGRLDTLGQTQVKNFADAATAAKALAKLIAEKTGKGYVEEAVVAATAAKATPAAKPAAAAVKESAPAKAATDGKRGAAAKDATKPAPAPPKPAKKEPAKPEPAKGKKSAKPAVPAEPAAPVVERDTPEIPPSDGGWVPAADGYHLTLRDGKLVCRNAKGKELASVPAKIADSPVGEQLDALREWLEEHARECRAQVEAWLLRSLPVPVRLIEAVWPDPAWRGALENAVVQPCGTLGEPAAGELGFLRGADAARGVGLVTLDGETVWTRTPAVRLPHPVLLAERVDFQSLAGELGLAQGVQQLLRETHARGDLPATATSVERFADGAFEQLNFAVGASKTLGYAVKGGYAVCTVIEDGATTTASFWIGADDPSYETATGSLIWSAGDRQLTLGEVPPVAFSEGMRMAAAIYAKRKVEAAAAS